MKRFFIILSGLLLVGVTNGATLEELQTAFMSRYDEANGKRDEQFKKLESSYLGALERHLDKAQGTGDLEEVLPVRNEIEAIKTSADPLPALAKSASTSLQSLRGKYVGARDKINQEHAKSLIALSEKMDQALKTKEAELTKAGEIDDALAARRMRETLGNDAGLKAAREGLEASSMGGGREWVPLFTGDNQKIQEAGSYWVGDIEGVRGEGTFDPNLRPTFGKLKETNGAPHFLACAPAKVRFKLDRPFSSLSAKLWINEGGDVKVNFLAGGKLIESIPLGGSGRQQVPVQLEFDAVREITFEVDPNGSNAGDWTVLMSPRVR